ncbi:group III truncated hemoglobin [Muricauda sp. CAU 1633]|nr:group III truncated hemoglobin [Muricauda sp. CAU 1633]MBO0323784.1 group III truncated hemoglobin [Muricauda sp. CAU 1633]
MKNEIRNREDIKLLVDTFYGKVKINPLLGPIFNDTIGDDWSGHLEKMYAFWQTVLFHEKAYQGTPFHPHLSLPIGKDHFEQWLKLFQQTIDENFEGQIAEMAMFRANKIAEMFQYKLAHLKGDEFQNN